MHHAKSAEAIIQICALLAEGTVGEMKEMLKTTASGPTIQRISNQLSSVFAK